MRPLRYFYYLVYRRQAVVIFNMYKLTPIIFAAFILTGCAGVYAPQQDNFTANEHLDRSEFHNAIAKYKGALAAARFHHDEQYEAIAMYGLGRAYGYLCNYELAESWFIQSIKLRESLPDSDEAYLSQNILELARLYEAAGEDDKAAGQYARAVPLLEDADIERLDPAGYINVLKDYAALLNRIDSERYKNIHNKLATLKAKHPNAQSGFVARPYPTECGGGRKLKIEKSKFKMKIKNEN